MITAEIPELELLQWESAQTKHRRVCFPLKSPNYPFHWQLRRCVCRYCEDAEAVWRRRTRDENHWRLWNLRRQYELATTHSSQDHAPVRRTHGRIEQNNARLLMNKLSDLDRIRGGYSFTDLVSECSFAGKTCTSYVITSNRKKIIVSLGKTSLHSSIRTMASVSPSPSIAILRGLDRLKLSRCSWRSM